MTQLVIPSERIDRAILLIRGRKVMLDRDLAELYEVETFRLNEAVKRNIDRFPEDFMFPLTQEEWEGLISQFAISKPVGRGGRALLPTPSPSRAWRCSPASCGVRVPSRSTLKSYGPS